MELKKLAIPPPWAMWIGLAVGFQARPSVIPPLWRDDRCAPGNIGQADLEGNHSYKFIYSRVFAADPGGRNLLILLVGAVRFELTTPCAQGGGMANSFRSISPLGINVPRRKHLQSANWPVDDFVAAQNLTHPPASTTGRQEHYGNNTWTRGYGRLSVTAIGGQIPGGHARRNLHKNREWLLFRAAKCASKVLYPLTLVTARAILPLVAVLPLAEVPSQGSPKIRARPKKHKPKNN